MPFHMYQGSGRIGFWKREDRQSGRSMWIWMVKGAAPIVLCTAVDRIRAVPFTMHIDMLAQLARHPFLKSSPTWTLAHVRGHTSCCCCSMPQSWNMFITRHVFCSQDSSWSVSSSLHPRHPQSSHLLCHEQELPSCSCKKTDRMYMQKQWSSKTLLIPSPKVPHAIEWLFNNPTPTKS